MECHSLQHKSNDIGSIATYLSEKQLHKNNFDRIVMFNKEQILKNRVNKEPVKSIIALKK